MLGLDKLKNFKFFKFKKMFKVILSSFIVATVAQQRNSEYFFLYNFFEKLRSEKKIHHSFVSIPAFTFPPPSLLYTYFPTPFLYSFIPSYTYSF